MSREGSTAVQGVPRDVAACAQLGDAAEGGLAPRSCEGLGARFAPNATCPVVRVAEPAWRPVRERLVRRAG